MHMVPFWYGRVAGVANLPAYDNYYLWTKYKSNYLNVQNEPPKSENWKWWNPRKKATLLSKLNIYSAFPLRVLKAAQLMVSENRIQGWLEVRLRIEEEVPERRDLRGRIQRSACKLCSNTRLISELWVCVGDSKEPSKKDKAVTRSLNTEKKKKKTLVLHHWGDMVWSMSSIKCNCRLKEKKSLFREKIMESRIS